MMGTTELNILINTTVIKRNPSMSASKDVVDLGHMSDRVEQWYQKPENLSL